MPGWGEGMVVRFSGRYVEPQRAACRRVPAELLICCCAGAAAALTRPHNQTEGTLASSSTNMSFRLVARARRISTARLTVFERASGASVLFEDRYAALLSGEGGEVAPADLATVTSLADTLAIRTRAIDAWLEKPSWPPVRTTRRQGVLLGMD